MCLNNKHLWAYGEFNFYIYCLVFYVHLLLFSLPTCSYLYLISLLLFFFLLSFYILSLLPLTFHINAHHFASSLPLSPVLFHSSSPPSRPLSILAPQERNAVIFLLLPKPPLENIGLIKVKGKGLKRKVFHASCEWYAGPENSKVPSLCFFLPIPLLQCSLCCDIITAPPLVSSEGRGVRFQRWLVPASLVIRSVKFTHNALVH